MLNRLAPFFVLVAPIVFVCLWATGFIGAKLGLPYVEPLTFLAVRFVAVVLILAPFVLWRRASLGGWAPVGHLLFVGLMVHGVYLGGVFIAIGLGMSAGLSALIVSLQPLLTAVMAAPLLLGERSTKRQLLGLLLGLSGVVLVLSDRYGLLSQGFAALQMGEDFLWPVLFCIAALFGITFGVVYQKRYCADADLWSGVFVQYLSAALFTGVLALIFEDNRIVWSGEFVFALGWLVLILSIGAVSLLMLLIRWGAASRVASMFYLVPPVTALVAFFLFDERLGPLALLGMFVTVAGVALVVVAPKKAA
ncbi:DMT family transporter [Rhodovibrionaceae bacterium A322]